MRSLKTTGSKICRAPFIRRSRRNLLGKVNKARSSSVNIAILPPVFHPIDKCTRSRTENLSSVRAIERDNFISTLTGDIPTNIKQGGENYRLWRSIKNL